MPVLEVSAALVVSLSGSGWESHARTPPPRPAPVTRQINEADEVETDEEVNPQALRRRGGAAASLIEAESLEEDFAPSGEILRSDTDVSDAELDDIVNRERARQDQTDERAQSRRQNDGTPRRARHDESESSEEEDDKLNEDGPDGAF